MTPERRARARGILASFPHTKTPYLIAGQEIEWLLDRADDAERLEAELAAVRESYRSTLACLYQAEEHSDEFAARAKKAEALLARVREWADKSRAEHVKVAEDFSRPWQVRVSHGDGADALLEVLNLLACLEFGCERCGKEACSCD